MTDADHLLGLFKSAHLAGLGRAAHTAANATSPARKYEQRRRASGSASTPVLFLTLYPAETDGGGERFLFNAALSALEAGAEVHLACLDRSIVGRQPGTEFARTGVYFATSADQFGGVKPLAFRDLLNMLELYEHVYVGQYLGSSLIFDILARVAPEQQLYLVNLGFEPFASEFWDSYRVAPNHHFTAISKYAASRIPERIPGRRTESAALWRHETAPRAPMATSDSQICVVGRMLPHKGFETAIRASPEGVRTIIIGDLSHDDEYYRYLKVVAAGANVSFAGEISSSYKAKLLDESRCLVAASTTKLYDGRTIPQAELLGLVLFEAVSHGCIPVATRIPAFTEVMHDLDLSEFLFPENDAAAARALIEQVMGMSDSARLARLDMARQRVQAHYLWDDYWTRVRVNR